MRIGTHAEADFFRKLPQAFDVLMINANLLAGTPAASAAFIHGLEKPYIIDPFTHAFPLPPRYLRSKQKNRTATAAPKRTFVELGSRYFPELGEFVGERSVIPENIDAGALATRVLDYQNNWYMDIIGNDTFLLEGGMLTPNIIIAPYFVMEGSLSWLPVNVACAKAARAIEPSSAIVVAVTLSLLRSFKTEIVEAYKDLGSGTAFLWIESFDEDTANAEDLALYCTFISELCKAKIEPINLFGGFFSCIAADYGLSGFVHGLVYGENKAFAPVLGGGQPPPRYYFKPLHVAQNVLESQSLLVSVDSDTYQDKVCDCAICRRVVGMASPALAMSKFAEVNDQNKFTPTAYALCRFHFMLARRDEVMRFRTLSHDGKLEFLQENIDFLSKIGASDLGQHLSAWYSLVK